MEERELIPHLFRTEYRKIISVLCRHFGFNQIETAEDLASETFLTAAQSWPLHGIPDNPQAWLYRVAKNKARNFLKRRAVFENNIVPLLKGLPEKEGIDIDLSPQNIKDSQLQMIFAICHPALPMEAQVGLSLRILCGLGIEEIADAFLTGKEVINKRLYRAREKIRKEGICVEMPPAGELDHRLEGVLRTIYLLFNEGYYSISSDKPLRKELCFEAMHLCFLLLENEPTNKPPVAALMALMCFHASRFEARETKNGEIILYEEQDIRLWDQKLISEGAFYLNRAATGDRLSSYHLEAAIAFWNTKREDTIEKWEAVLDLYDQLLQLEYTPVAAMNRIYALSKLKGKEAAIREAEKLKTENNQFYHTLLGELYTHIDHPKALRNFERAKAMAKTAADRQLIQSKIDKIIAANT